VDKKWKSLTVDFPAELTPQRAKLSIDFQTELSDTLRGFYRSSYKNKDGVTKFLGSTQFEVGLKVVNEFICLE
jgi:hypothetical protein